MKQSYTLALFTLILAQNSYCAPQNSNAAISRYKSELKRFITSNNNDKLAATTLITFFLKNYHRGINNPALIDQLTHEDVQDYAIDLLRIACCISHDDEENTLSFQGLPLDEYGDFNFEEDTHNVCEVITLLEATHFLSNFPEYNSKITTDDFIVNKPNSNNESSETEDDSVATLDELATIAISYSNERRGHFVRALVMLYNLNKYGINEIHFENDIADFTHLTMCKVLSVFTKYEDFQVGNTQQANSDVVYVNIRYGINQTLLEDIEPQDLNHPEVQKEIEESYLKRKVHGMYDDLCKRFEQILENNQERR